MKFRITQKQAREYYNLYRIDTNTSHIISHHIYPTTAYHAGVYGWNADIFINGYIGLENGYRPIAKKDVPEKLQELFCNRCKKIIDNCSNYKERTEKLQKEFNDLCNVLRNN